MKKILILLTLLITFAAACSIGPAKQAEGKWKNSEGQELTVKDDKLKVNIEGSTVEGTIKDDEDHKDLAKIKLVGETAYVKVKDDTLTVTEEPGEAADDETTFTRVK